MIAHPRAPQSILHTLPAVGFIIPDRDRHTMTTYSDIISRQAAIVAHWLSDDTVPAKRLTARAESICRFLGGRRHV